MWKHRNPPSCRIWKPHEAKVSEPWTLDPVFMWTLDPVFTNPENRSELGCGNPSGFLALLRLPWSEVARLCLSLNPGWVVQIRRLGRGKEPGHHRGSANDFKINGFTSNQLPLVSFSVVTRKEAVRSFQNCKGVNVPFYSTPSP